VKFIVVAFICFIIIRFVQSVIKRIFSQSDDTNGLNARKRKNGKEAEMFVSNELRRRNLGIVYNNLIFPSAYTKTAQIDHIFINQFGVFVIETKGHFGCIIGNPYNKKLVVEMKDRRYIIDNPILQNRAHWHIVKDILENKVDFNIPIFSYVIVTKATIMLDYPYIGDINDFTKYVISLKPQLSFEEIKTIERILLIARDTKTSDAKHRRNIKKYLRNQKLNN
jgi:hypothetical protein